MVVEPVKQPRRGIELRVLAASAEGVRAVVICPRIISHEGAMLSLGAAFGYFEGVDAILGSARQNWLKMPHMHHWMANPVAALKSVVVEAVRATKQPRPAAGAAPPAGPVIPPCGTTAWANVEQTT